MDYSIGIFDSGLGGLTVLKAIHQVLPKEQIQYFGDTARVPYGTKSKATITKFSEENIRFLLSLNVKVIVVGCHTASSLALKEMRRIFNVPIFGVVDPGAQKAVNSTKNNKIGVIGTNSTIESGAYAKAIKKLSPKSQVLGSACPLFVSLIEEGWTAGHVVDEVAKIYLKPFKDSDIDTLVLGCTHYPVLGDLIQKHLPGVELINPADETAYAVQEYLNITNALKTSSTSDNAVQYYVSDAPEHFNTPNLECR